MGVKQKLLQLFSVKSIETLMLTAVFTRLSFQGEISGQEFLTVFTVVIAFYFGTQYERHHRDHPED